MSNMYHLVARVVSQKGTCANGHGVGDEFVLGDKTPEGLCSWAFAAIFPFVNVLQFGGAFPWGEDPDRTTVACPDPDNPVVFEVRRKRAARKH
ncbi:MAG: TIGR04076 family protein [Chloroflexota bacterium]